MSGRTLTPALTLVYGVIGDPIAHSFSPQIHRYFAGLTGINMAYVPFHVRSADIPEAIAGAKALNIRGLNVTVPHKRSVIPYLSVIDPVAARIGSVNTLTFSSSGITGHNTDHIGITRTLASAGLSFKDRPVTIFGAGGSAYAACVAAAEGQAKQITVVNRSLENAAILASHVKKYYTTSIETAPLSGFPAAGEGAVIIQTSLLGFGPYEGQSPVSDLSFFRDASLAFDAVYAPWETAFLKQARKAGVTAVNGFPMLVYQAAASFALWFDIDAEQVDLSEQAHMEKLSDEYRYANG